MTKGKIRVAQIALAGAASTLAIGAGLIHNAQAQLRPDLGGPSTELTPDLSVPNTGLQGTPVDTRTGGGGRPSLSQKEKACMRRLSKDLNKLASQTKTSIKARDKEIVLGSACTVKVTKGLQIKAARSFIQENFGQDPGNPVNVIRGASPSSPSLILFGDKALASNRLPRSNKKVGRAFYVVTGSTPAHLDIYAGGNSIPSYVGLGPGMHKTLAKLGKKGTFKVVGISGNPVAPTLLLQDSRGKKFGFSYSNSKILPASRLTKYNYPKPSRITELEARLNWAILEDRKS